MQPSLYPHSDLTSDSTHTKNDALNNPLDFLPVTVANILRSRVYDVAIETPLEYAKLASQKLAHHIYFKREDLQPVFSFKIRGAYNKMAHLTQAEKIGVIAASAGNHAQGVALSAARLCIPCQIVMPVTTPTVKIEAVRNFGGEWVQIVLHGNSYQEAFLHAKQLQETLGYTFIHPFDDPYVIAGQGTIGVEILKQFQQQTHDEIDAIFIAIGGGGLVAGVASYIKAIAPHIKIIGVQTQDSNAMQQSIANDEIIHLKDVGLFSDGTAVKQVGELTFAIAKRLIDDIITVNTDEMCAAIKDIFEDTRSIVEPAGALALAGIKKYIQQLNLSSTSSSMIKPQHSKHSKHRQHLVAINCGANMNFDRLRFVAERAQIGEAKEAIFAISIPEKPGSLKQFCEVIGQHHITEFNYRYSNKHKHAGKAHIFLGLNIANNADLEALEQQLQIHAIEYINLTHDEISKLHIRHMVGGVAELSDEQLIHVEFPERPQALLNFLQQIQTDWNISLFHYRNHGADYGRVLIGIQVPATQIPAFSEFLAALPYPCQHIQAHPAYHLFLS